MTIKEIEGRAGLTRANIRFYEAEGLIAPKRQENGYREYTKEDLETLKKIKLLRALRISLEEIKRIHAGQESLDSALARHMIFLQQEQAALTRSSEVCRSMRSDGAEYQTLDAQRYLNALVMGLPARTEPMTVPDTDSDPGLYAPCRRFFARMFDLFTYNILWTALLTLVFNVNPLLRSNFGRFFDSIMTIVLMLLLEPAQLVLFGTTLGKALLGLRVEHSTGRKLTYGEGLYRTWWVFVKGLGLQIPIYGIYRYWKSYEAYYEDEPLAWEEDSEVTEKDHKRWRVAVFIGAYAAAAGVLVLAVALSILPKHRGDITVAQFSQNFNQLSDYYKVYNEYLLDENGQWINSREGNTLYFAPIDPVYYPKFEFTERDGYMTGMWFSTEIADPELYLVPTYQNIMDIAILSFVNAQAEGDLFSGKTGQLLDTVNASPYESFTYEVNGIVVTCRVAYTGYLAFDGYLWPAEGETQSYSFFFSMEKKG